MWGAPETDVDVADLLDSAQDDWLHMGMLTPIVIHRTGPGSSLVEQVTALGELVGVLIDCGVVPGDLADKPDFAPWQGTRAERVARIVQETSALGRLPHPAEVAWFDLAKRER